MLYAPVLVRSAFIRSSLPSLTPYLLDIGEAGSINDALWTNVSLRTGTYVYRRHLTKKSLSAMFGMPHRDIELLIASGIGG